MKTTTFFLIAVIATILTIETASAQIIPVSRPDALFPGEGKASLTFWSGIPYIGIAEYAYGVSDKFSVGVIGGYTPTTKAIGIRLRAIVAGESDNFRLYIKTPILFY